MCYTKVYATNHKKLDEVSATAEGFMLGYKCFNEVSHEGNNRLWFPIQSSGRPVMENRWLTSSDDVIYSNRDDVDKIGFRKQYTAGFHIFLKESDAKAYKPSCVVRKVAFKEVVAIGDNGGLCVTAKKMKVLPLK